MSQFLWLLLASTLAISHLTVATPVPSPMPGSRCPDKCGGVQIPYPFGIGDHCARPGGDYFRVDCNYSFNSPTPRPYTGGLEIIDISLEAGEVRVAAPVSYICYTSSNTFSSSKDFAWQVYDPYLISTERNVFTAIGCNTLAILQGREDWSYYTGCITSCASLEEAARDGEDCTGLGCCQTHISRNLSTIGVTWNNGTRSINPAWSYSPCSYAMLAEEGRYKFNRRDLIRAGNDSFATWVEQEKIPMVLDWAIRRNGSCQPPAKDAGPLAKMTAPACVSEHSFCLNATQGPGYLCNCSEGYRGNPYKIGGCTNINECQEYENPCHSSSTCHDTQGDYECKCKFGLKGDGRRDNGCQLIFPPWAIAIIGTCEKQHHSPIWNRDEKKYGHAMEKQLVSP